MMPRAFLHPRAMRAVFTVRRQTTYPTDARSPHLRRLPMRSVPCALAAGLAACLAGGLARAEDKTEPTRADKLVGSWVVTKAPAGLGWVPGTTLEFKKDGKLVIEVKPGAGGLEGTYTVDGGAV